MNRRRLTCPRLLQPSEKGHLSVCSMRWSITCPMAHCTFKQNISKLQNLHKMRFSVALFVRNRSALAGLQAPLGYQILNKQKLCCCRDCGGACTLRKDGQEQPGRIVLKQYYLSSASLTAQEEYAY